MNMKKEIYVTPDMEIVVFDASVLTTSSAASPEFGSGDGDDWGTSIW